MNVGRSSYSKKKIHLHSAGVGAASKKEADYTRRSRSHFGIMHCEKLTAKMAEQSFSSLLEIKELLDDLLILRHATGGG